MNFQYTFFQLALVAIPVFSLMVIFSRHPVFSLIFLVCSFLFSTLVLFFMECELLALLFIIVYVGAIAILFLFAIMMLEFKFKDLSKNSLKYFPIGFLILILLISILCRQTFTPHNLIADSHYFYFNGYQNWYDLSDTVDDIEIYGNILYSFFVFQFLVCGFILLLVLIGVVCYVKFF